MMPVSPVLTAKQIQDVYIRKNFEALIAYFAAQNQLLNFKCFEQVFTKAQNKVQVAHGFGSIPQDVIVSKIVGAGQVQFLFGIFDVTNIYLNVSGACTVRFMVGTYPTVDPTAAPSKSDLMVVQAVPSSSGLAGQSPTPLANGSERIGTVINWPSETTPTDCLRCDGTLYKITDYPDLAKVLGNNHGGDGVVTFAVPQYAGRSLRGWAGSSSLGRALDADTLARVAMATGGVAGNRVGSVQSDAIRNITGSVNDIQSRSGAQGAGTGAWYVSYTSGSSYGGSGGVPNFGLAMDASRQVPVGSDNRPNNAYINWVIKAK